MGKRIQRPPDARMNPLSEHFHHLSLGALLLTTLQVTGCTSSVSFCLSQSAFLALLLQQLQLQRLLVFSRVETASLLLRVPCMLPLTRQAPLHPTQISSSASLLDFSYSKTPSNWPPSSRTAIRYVLSLSGLCGFLGVLSPQSGALLPVCFVFCHFCLEELPTDSVSISAA